MPAVELITCQSNKVEGGELEGEGGIDDFRCLLNQFGPENAEHRGAGSHYEENIFSSAASLRQPIRVARRHKVVIAN